MAHLNTNHIYIFTHPVHHNSHLFTSGQRSILKNLELFSTRHRSWHTGTRLEISKVYILIRKGFIGSNVYIEVNTF